MKTRRFNVTLPEHMLEKLSQLAKANNVSMGTIIKLSIDDYIRKTTEDQTLNPIHSGRNANDE